ncbi:MAG: signal peptide peptidase SppA [Tepidisphaeraceae bacterium]
MRTGLFLGLALLLSGCGMPSFLVTPVSGTYELHEEVVQPGKGLFPDKIALIPVEGMLLDARSGGLLQAQENPMSLFIEELDQAAADPSVKAVVLRVNSPGGSVTTSDTMYDAILRFKDKTHKPVIASAQEVDASGAYYVSCGADKIVASPTSVVGSIGVIFETFDFVGTMQMLGVQSDAIKSAELKDMGSPFKHMTPHERALMQEMVNEYYARFKSVVFSHRSIKDADTQTLVTDGQVFSGEKAVDLGLVDETGRLDDALDMARQMSGSPDAEAVMYKRPYGYTGSIYADTSVPTPSSSSQMNLQLPLAQEMVPSGFYYLWRP